MQSQVGSRSIFVSGGSVARRRGLKGCGGRAEGSACAVAPPAGQAGNPTWRRASGGGGVREARRERRGWSRTRWRAAVWRAGGVRVAVARQTAPLGRLAIQVRRAVMPDISQLVLFTAAAFLLAITPGPGIFYVAARTLAGGRPEGIASSFGTGLGGMVHVLAGSVGVSAIVLASAELFTALKLIGAAYLVFIGIRTIQAARRDAATVLTGGPATPPVGANRAFREGVLVEALNPKTAAFFLAFVPQFVDTAVASVAMQFVVLGAVSVVMNTLADVVVAFAASGIREGAAARPGVIRWMREASGGAMIALGIGLALVRRPAT